MGLIFALAFGFVPGAARAQEDEPPPQYEYALDDQTELTLTAHPKDSKTWTAELRQYGDPAQGQIFTTSVEVRLQSKDVYSWKAESPPGQTQNQKQVRIGGKPGEKLPLEVSTRYFVDDFQKPARIHGTFKPVDKVAREARVKKRFELADAALNDLFKRTTAEVGKAGEAKLKQVHEERLKLRDAAAGGDEAEKSGVPYWNAMWTGTLDCIGFLRSYTGKNATKGFPGSYRMPNGNSLELEVVPDEGLRFTIQVRNPAGEKPGTITGMARLFTTRANYKEPLSKKDAESRPPTEVVFTQRGHIVHVEAKNTEEYGGPGVSFDGDYYKTVPRK